VTAYKGFTIEYSRATGWYSANTPDGYLKADTLPGIKQLIKQYLARGWR